MVLHKKETTAQRQLLGQVLLKRGVITQSQLKHALDTKKKEGGYLGEILIRLGAVEEHEVVAALVVQCHIPYIAIDKYDIDRSIIQLVPAGVARKYHVIPLDRVKDILSLVMVDPLDMTVKTEVQRITNCRLAPFIAAKGEIDRAIQRWYDN